MSRSETVQVTLLLTFHDEGDIAARTLTGVERCLSIAREAGIVTECLAVLDNASLRTRQVVEGSIVPDRCITTNLGDAGEARNAGVAVAKGEWVTVCDGDDHLSGNWISEAYRLGILHPSAVLHPEYIVNFGSSCSFQKAPDPETDIISDEALLGFNPWSVWAMAHRKVFLDHPYQGTRTAQTGFGFEDWHWHLETLAAGHPHRLVGGTAGFYRRKPSGRHLQESGGAATLRQTAFFAPARFLAVRDKAS